MIGIERSRRWRLRGGVCAAILAGLAHGGSAQLAPGDVLTLDTGGVVALRGGVAVVTMPLPVSTLNPYWYTDVATDVDNRSVVVVRLDPRRIDPGAVLRLAPGVAPVTVTTLHGLGAQLSIDDVGEYVLPLNDAGLHPRIARITPAGVLTVRNGTPATPSTMWWIAGASGDPVLGGEHLVFTMDRATGAIRSSVHMPAWYTYAQDAVHDVRTGLTWFAAHAYPIFGESALMSYDPVRRAVTAQLKIHSTSPYAAASVGHDRRSDTFLVGCSGNNGSMIFRVTRAFAATTVAPRRAAAIDVWGQRHIVASSGAPRVGATFGLSLREPAEPNASYVAAASLAPRPGIQTPAGIVDLQPDALFALSLSNPALFRGFAGQLDAAGDATASVAIPPFQALRGARFYVSFVTMRGGRIASVANTATFTIE